MKRFLYLIEHPKQSRLDLKAFLAMHRLVKEKFKFSFRVGFKFSRFPCPEVFSEIIGN